MNKIQFKERIFGRWRHFFFLSQSVPTRTSNGVHNGKWTKSGDKILFEWNKRFLYGKGINNDEKKPLHSSACTTTAMKRGRGAAKRKKTKSEANFGIIKMCALITISPSHCVWIYLFNSTVFCRLRWPPGSTIHMFGGSEKVKFSCNCVSGLLCKWPNGNEFDCTPSASICSGIFSTGHIVLQYVRFYIELIAEVKCDQIIMANTLLSLLSLPLLLSLKYTVPDSRFHWDESVWFFPPFYEQRHIELYHSQTAQVKRFQTLWVI